MMANNFQTKLRQIQAKIPQLVKRIPGIAKTEGLRFIADNFKHQGFEEKPGQYKPWQKKKKKDARKPVLIGEKRGGAMRRSWEGKSDTKHAEFSSQKPYTEVHNEGLQAGRPPGFIMPERRMIGESEAFNKRIEDKLDKMVDDVYL